MITVHHLNNSRSQRVIWLLEELGLPYEVKRYERDAETMLAPDSLRQVHPLGKSPVITEGDRTIAETGAIIEYLLDKPEAEGWRPAPGTEALCAYRYWLHYAEGSLMPVLLLRLVFDQLESGPVPFFIKPVTKAIGAAAKSKFVGPQVALHLNHVEASLKDRDWFTGGRITGADIMMSFPLEAAESREVLGNRPRIAAWLATVHGRPAYQRALKAGGPYDFA